MTASAPSEPDSTIAMRHSANDTIAAVASRYDDGGGRELVFMCECGKPDCAAVVRMTLEAYRDAAPGSIVAHS